MKNTHVLGLTLLLLAACASACVDSPTNQSNAAATADLKPAVESINTEDMMRHIQKLASDEFEGRAPASKGEELTVNYLTEQFRAMGLKPGNPDGTYVQEVPLVGFKAQPTASFNAGGRDIALAFPTDYVAVSRRFQPEVKVENSDIVFVGYGVDAPEYQWNDYKDVDVRGKTVVMFINDPAIPATTSAAAATPAPTATDAPPAAETSKPAANASNTRVPAVTPAPTPQPALDENMFKGKAMTYYGRWTYKYEEASRKGAAAAIIVHETGPAGYGYNVVADSWGRENFDIRTPDNNAGRVQVEGWITLDRAKELFSASGQNFDQLKQAALRKDFRPVALNAKANFTVANTVRDVRSKNVVAKLEGSDAKLKDEYVVYTAHWDHLGRDETKQGDQISNGAIDNASGTAMLLELAEAFSKLKPAPKRSVLFLAVTAEEKGLLGAKYYAENPLYPLAKTVANINIDGVNQWGRTSDVVIVGLGNSTLEDITREVAAEQKRTIKPDPEPEKGFYYRSDHFEFAKQGVPALYTDTGTEYVGRDPDFAMRKRKEYEENDYHSITDEVKPDWDLAGAVEDAQLLLNVGHRVAQADAFPEWKPGTEFKAKRDAMLGK